MRSPRIRSVLSRLEQRLEYQAVHTAFSFGLKGRRDVCDGAAWMESHTSVPRLLGEDHPKRFDIETARREHPGIALAPDMSRED